MPFAGEIYHVALAPERNTSPVYMPHVVIGSALYMTDDPSVVGISEVGSGP